MASSGRNQFKAEGLATTTTLGVERRWRNCASGARYPTFASPEQGFLAGTQVTTPNLGDHGNSDTRPIGLADFDLTAEARAQDALDVARLGPLMQRSSGTPGVKVALVDGPVATDHPDLAVERIREIPGVLHGTCARAQSAACRHGTFVAGVLHARRGSEAPAICPGCTLLIRPIFAETTDGGGMPSASPEDLAAAVIDAADFGARVVNVSAALRWPHREGEHAIDEALSYAARRGVIVVAAAGNDRTIGGSALARHAGVIAVAACDGRGRPVSDSNLGSSIGQRGVSAPGLGITSLGPASDPVTLGGTSAAAPFVTGTIALLWSEFPTASAAEVRSAVTNAAGRRRTTVVPPLLDAWAAYRKLAASVRS